MARPLLTNKEDLAYAFELRRTAKNKWDIDMALSVILPATQNLSLEKTASILACSARTVQKLRQRLQRHRLGEDVRDKRGGRHRQNLTLAEEKEFLSRWREQAEKGEIVIGSEMREQLSRRLKRPVCESVFYRLLHRHGWRKVAPDTRHPKSAEAVQEAWKKNFRWNWQLSAGHII